MKTDHDSNRIDHGLVWSKVHEDKSIGIGFTKQAIEERLQECFHVLQADTQAVREKGPMLVLETNDGLESIKSPFTGRISYFNSKARNFPDKLTEEDTILTILPPGVVPKAKTRAQKIISPPVWAPADFFTTAPVTEEQLTRVDTPEEAAERQRQVSLRLNAIINQQAREREERLLNIGRTI